MPDFKELNKKMANLYPESNQARRILQYADVPTGNIDFSGSARNMWFSVLMELKKHKTKMHDVLQEAHDEYPEDEILLAAIQKETQVKLNVDANTQLKQALKGQVSAIQGKEIPTSLSVDGGMLEKVMQGRNDIVEINWLYKAIEASKSVCKVELSNGQSGTGWIIGKNYLMTNNHVLPNATAASKARAIFNFQKAGDKKQALFNLKPDQTFITSQALDYSIVSIEDDGNLSDFGSLELEVFKDLKSDELVNIIQHPEGKDKKIAMPDEIISVWPEKNYLFYLADTQPGSSGSPVFNQDWKVVALHHAGRDASGGGLTINANGDKHEANRGIIMTAIVEDLKNQGLNL